MSLTLIAWGMIAGGSLVGLYGLLLRFYTLRFWDSQLFVAFYLLLTLTSFLLLAVTLFGHTVYVAPYIPSIVLWLWLTLTVTYVPVRITRSIVSNGFLHVLTPGTIFIISVSFSLLLASLFLILFLSRSPVWYLGVP